MRYIGEGSVGTGVLYIDKGVVVGVDTGDIRYHGTYIENAGRLRLQVTMTASETVPHS